MVCGVGPQPRTHTLFLGMVQFKATHSRDPRTQFRAHGVQCFGWLGHHPKTHTIFLGIVRFKHTHGIPGIQKHLFWAVVCSCMGGTGATPEPTGYFLASCSLKTPILGIPKNSFWPMVCGVLGGWSASPELTPYFLACCVAIHPSWGSRNIFSG